MTSDPYALMPEVDARRALAGSALELRLLRPPYPALGLGRLRVLRVRAIGEGLEVLAGYEGYERLPE